MQGIQRKDHKYGVCSRNNHHLRREYMIWQQTPYTIPLIVASVVSIALGIYIWGYRPSTRGRITSIVILANSWWMLTYALELAGADLSTKVFWDKLQYLGIVVVPTGWFIYTLFYTGREKWLTSKRLMLLSFIPLITLVLALTNDYHRLLWSTYTLLDTPFVVLHNTYGVWLWFFITYSYTLIFIGIILLIQMFVYSRPLYRWQTSTLIFGAWIPWIASVLDAVDMRPLPYLDLTPLAFMVTNITLAISLFYLRLEDIVPLARETLIENMRDSVVVLDTGGRIVDVNPSAQQLISSEELIGAPIDDVWPEWSQIGPGEDIETGKEIVMDHIKRIYDVSVSPLTDWRGHTVGRIVVLRDVTDRKRSERIKKSLREKEILLREIHHRVKNNIQIISSLLNLQTHYIKDKSYVDMLRESQHRIRSMGLIHEKLYQSENLAEIHFTEYVKTLVYSLFRSYGVNTGRIAVKTDIEDISLDIDTAIPCGLIINELVSNSLKYAFPGERTGEITIQLHSRNGHIELVVADNGTGIPEHIDFRTTSSLGLHLVTILVEEQLKGEISLDRNKGTAFHITFRKKQSQNC